MAIKRTNDSTVGSRLVTSELSRATGVLVKQSSLQHMVFRLIRFLTCVSVNVHVYVCVCVYVSIHVCTFVYVCVHMSESLDMYLCMYVCAYVCVCLQVS